jgi:hypothetical protein
VGTVWTGITPRGDLATLDFYDDTTVNVDYGDGTDVDYTYNYSPYKGTIDGPIGDFSVDPVADPAIMTFKDWWGHGITVVFTME